MQKKRATLWLDSNV